MSGAREYRQRMPIRWTDIDRLGHMNQAVYHELLEEGRAGFLMGLVRDAGGPEAVGMWVVARVELDYRAEVRKSDGDVEVVVRVGHVGNASVRLDHDIIRPDGVIAASGSTVLVAWDATARGKRPVTDVERAALDT